MNLQVIQKMIELAQKLNKDVSKLYNIYLYAESIIEDDMTKLISKQFDKESSSNSFICTAKYDNKPCYIKAFYINESIQHKGKIPFALVVTGQRPATTL